MTIITPRMMDMYMEFRLNKKPLQIKAEHPNWNIRMLYYHYSKWKKGYRPFKVIIETVSQ
jgi:hypothetical protein